MQSINFDDGFKEYDINGDESRVIRVNVTDINILSRSEEAGKKIEQLTADMRSDTDNSPAALAEYDRRFREQINFIFGSDVCTVAFGNTHCMSLVSDGRMLFEGFLDALLAQVRADMDIAMSKTRESAKVRTDKYIDPVITADKSGDPIEGMTSEEKDELLRKLMK